MPGQEYCFRHPTGGESLVSGKGKEHQHHALKKNSSLGPFRGGSYRRSKNDVAVFNGTEERKGLHVWGGKEGKTEGGES